MWHFITKMTVPFKIRQLKWGSVLWFFLQELLLFIMKNTFWKVHRNSPNSISEPILCSFTGMHTHTKKKKKSSLTFSEMAEFQPNWWSTLPPTTAQNSMLKAGAWEAGGVTGDSSGPERNVTQVSFILDNFCPLWQKRTAPFLLTAS